MYREYLNGKTVLVTGAAGFIGANLVRALLGTGAAVNVIGLDNVNDYYDVSIKEYRLKELEKLAQAAPRASWQLVRGDLADRPLVDGMFERYRPQLVVNLAAQAGVRYSITDPDAYIKASLKPAAIPTTAARPVSRIWSTPPPPASTAPIRGSPTPLRTRPTAPCRSTRPPKKATS